MFYNFLGNYVSGFSASRPTLADAILIAGFIFCAAAAYLLGSLNFGIIFSKIFYKDDVRNHGSKNAGATNMQRTYGTAAGVITLCGDAAKAAASCLLGGFLLGLPGAYIAGLFCVVGHVFPLYYKFKGGKGVVTVAVLIAMTSIKTFIPLIIIFLVLVIGTRYISLGSVICAMLYPIILFKLIGIGGEATRGEYFGVLIAFAVAAIVVFKHRENIRRILNRTESKISFKKGKKKKEKKENIITENSETENETMSDREGLISGEISEKSEKTEPEDAVEKNVKDGGKKKNKNNKK